MIRLFLASSSPRRRQLLEQAGVPFVWGAPGVDDGLLQPGEVTPPEWVASLAFLKASSGLASLPGGTPGERWVVLGADTLVVKDGELIGQPRDAAHARRIVSRLSGGSHRVLTGIAIIDPVLGERHMLVDRADVRVGELDREEIDRYVAAGGWRGKAGGYNLNERLEAGWPIEYEGDPATIVGLPMRRLVPLLERIGVGGVGAGV